MVRVGGDSVSTARQAGTGAVGSAPAARRLGSSRWRDPRLAVGVVLVAASVALGARVVAASDDTVPVWSLRDDVPVGSPLTADDVTIARVHFDQADDADRYFDGDEPLPDDLVAGHELVAGELLSRSALVDPESGEIRELPLPVSEGFHPVDLAAGDRVDIWMLPGDETEQRQPVRLLQEGVTVLETDSASTAVGGSASVVVLVALEDGDPDAVAELLAAVADGSVYLTREGG
jgi:hypothetical protein